MATGVNKAAYYPTLGGTGYGGTSSFGSAPTTAQKPMTSMYDAAATTQAGDYDNIMKGYEDLIGRSKSGANRTPLNYVPINPVFQNQLKGTPYQRSSELNSALTGFQDYAKTGGYSDADIGNIRERSISPIRSIYSSAQEGLKRNRVLQGGYSPNYGAVSAKMARDASSKIGDITTKVNADIAEMVAKGKLSGLQGLGQTSQRDNELSNEANVRNADLENQVALMNAAEQRRVDDINRQGQFDVQAINNQNKQQDISTELASRQGQTSLYGTTPALTQLFGNQALANNAQDMQAVTTANAIKNQRANIGLNMMQSPNIYSGYSAGRG